VELIEKDLDFEEEFQNFEDSFDRDELLDISNVHIFHLILMFCNNFKSKKKKKEFSVQNNKTFDTFCLRTAFENQLV
jgi:hypothetical protein